MAGAATTTQTTEINGNSEKSSHPFHCSKEQEGNNPRSQATHTIIHNI
jgi:hypothetical protein